MFRHYLFHTNRSVSDKTTFRQELSGSPDRSALYSKINIITDTIAGVSDVVEQRVAKLDDEVKQVEKGSSWKNITGL